jgi:hypothetical protein
MTSIICWPEWTKVLGGGDGLVVFLGLVGCKLEEIEGEEIDEYVL